MPTAESAYKPRSKKVTADAVATAHRQQRRPRRVLALAGKNQR